MKVMLHMPGGAPVEGSMFGLVRVGRVWFLSLTREGTSADLVPLELVEKLEIETLGTVRVDRADFAQQLQSKRVA